MNAPITAEHLLRERAAPDRYATHEVHNQAAPATGFNAFSGDAVLIDAIAREAPWAAGRCAALGQLAGDEAVHNVSKLQDLAAAIAAIMKR